MGNEPNASSQKDWSQDEVELAVAHYFEMLRLELLGKRYGKTDHRNRLIPLLDQRSRGSVEFKHQNTSAVLVLMGYPYISGYKPRANFQSLLAEQVEHFLTKHPTFFDELTTTPVLDPVASPRHRRKRSSIFESPPERITPPKDLDTTWRPRIGKRIDFVQRDAENRRLGKMGEEFVVGIEKQRLIDKGRKDLAKRVEWVSNDRGDGAGFDVLSFDESTDAERYVEVKTTTLGKYFPFYVSSNELACSETCADRYRLFRVFNFAKAPRIFVLEGALSKACQLRPTQFRASM